MLWMDKVVDDEMSGGSLNYFYSEMESHIGDFGDKELDDLVKDLADLFYAREWFLSSDTCEGNWVEARDAFKEKWFSTCGREKRIETYLDELRTDVLKSFGLSDKYCINCVHWSDEDEPPYGVCDITEGCLMHRHECCEQFKRRQETE